MIDLAPTPATLLIESTTKITDFVGANTPVVSNAAICADSACTVGRAAINLFYYSSNPISKVCLGASCLCGTIGAASSGTAFVTSYMGLPQVGVAGAFGARVFNYLGKYTLHMGNVTSGQITNSAEIANLMS